MHRPPRKELSHIELQRVAVHDLESMTGEFLSEKIRQPRILFDGQNPRTGGEYRLGDCTKPWSDFHHEVGGGKVRLLHNPARKILVVQEVLSKRLYRNDANVAQSAADF